MNFNKCSRRLTNPNRFQKISAISVYLKACENFPSASSAPRSRGKPSSKRFLPMNLKKNFAPAIEAIKLYGLPFALIQCCAIAVVVSYYNFLTFREWCAVIAKWKVEGGLFFAAWTNAVAGAIFPEIFKSMTNRARRSITDASRLRDIIFNFCFFASSGIMVLMLYHYQGVWFGNENNLRTLVTKVSVDMLIWNPFFGAPYSIFIFLWREKHFNLIVAFRSFTFDVYKNRVLALLFPTWLYWLPIVSCIYSMPEHLQFPLYLCITTAWNLLFVFIVKSTASEPH